ncbi:C-terminal binding protein [Terrilactibacillus laevilacticus]|uniref:C-terminal binding protein n=1 Tax=Terrilactibacillus laevilacticus TaxID=1380157 RepID=A0ABW5PNI1_9BACI|nr:C-terminal binding protein [Terrilactibacillus laevilacticus]
MLNQKPFVWILDDEWTDHSIEKEVYDKYDFTFKVTRSETLEEDLKKYGPYADGVVAQIGFPCPRQLIEQLPACKAISISGVGYNHVDIDAATERGIPVANIPDYCTEEVSDHSIALMFALSRQLKDYDQKVRNGKWDPLDVLPLYRFKNQTVGILGFGRIGRLVARKLQMFGVRLIAYDKYVSDDEILNHGVEPVSLEELFSSSNILSLHVPLTEETTNMVNKETLAMMPKGAYVINTCRGAVINEEDLLDAIESGRIQGAGIDVLDREPPASNHPYFSCDRILLTPHSAYVTEESLRELKERTCQVIIDVVQGRKLNYALNQVESVQQ